MGFLFFRIVSCSITTRIGCLIFLPILTACSSDIDVSSQYLSKKQINVIIDNIEAMYPDVERELKQNIAQVVVKSIDNMTFVKGGNFVMGDFKVPCDIEDANRPIWRFGAKCVTDTYQSGQQFTTEVELSSYYLSKYETELLDYDLYLQALERPFEQFRYSAVYGEKGDYLIRGSKEYGEFLPHWVNQPVRKISWQDAKNYCQWIGKLASMPVDLPSEAQWEYAARSRGQKLYYATNNGFKQYRGRYYRLPDSDVHLEITSKTENLSTDISSVGRFDPNPLGIYDMTGNVAEWVHDWYSFDHYTVMASIDPRGPVTGRQKVVRGFGSTVNRAPKAAHRHSRVGFRCSVQPPGTF
ncbi:formylglycine-generating enzyme family protein [Vibrio chagasii]|uniref:formylglycine-generating enzyme family protein n=1 Tax=Vibrio chagasii TaxID=170679 RepID=UPI003DA1C4D0